MFTGIIETTAEILQKSPAGLVLARPITFSDLKRGSSVCVSGACLTVTELTDDTMVFDVVSETWSRTKLGKLKKGDAVNLERALRADGRLDGHIVQGHVEGVGKVLALEGKRQEVTLTIRLPQDLSALAAEKGSIALDGVSLTVASLEDDRCSVALIPETLSTTTLGTLKKGALVNVETDIVARYARQLLLRSMLSL